MLAALLATATSLPFAPPIEHPLRYRQVEQRIGADSSAMVFTLTEEASFVRDGSGYILTVRSLSVEAKAPPDAAAVFEAGMKPFVGVAVRIRLSSRGEPQSVIDADATWAKVVASFQDTIAATPESRRAVIKRALDVFATLPAPAREAMMMDPATTMVGLSIPDLPIDGSAPVSQRVETPFGPSLASTGTIHRLPDANGARRYHSETFTSADDAAEVAGAMRAANPDAASALAKLRLHEQIDTTLSASSGLLLSTTLRIAVVDLAAPGGERAVSQRALTLVSP